LFSCGGRIVVLKKTNNYSTTPRNQTTIRPPQENKQLFDHPKKTNNYSTTPRNQTTIRPPQEIKQLFDHHKKTKNSCLFSSGGRIVVCFLGVVE
jgi:hypothetical protein